MKNPANSQGSTSVEEKIQEGMSGIAGSSGLEGIGPSPEALNEAIANGLFTTDETPSQKSALHRLETIAALIEGWIDEVSASAALEHLPSLPALRESARRGRATGGPLQKAFAALIGLEISPRASRDAATFFNYIATNESISQRDELWSSPELLPTIEEISNPSEFRKGRSAPASQYTDRRSFTARLHRPLCRYRAYSTL